MFYGDRKCCEQEQYASLISRISVLMLESFFFFLLIQHFSLPEVVSKRKYFYNRHSVGTEPNTDRQGPPYYPWARRLWPPWTLLNPGPHLSVELRDGKWIFHVLDHSTTTALKFFETILYRPNRFYRSIGFWDEFMNRMTRTHYGQIVFII